MEQFAEFAFHAPVLYQEISVLVGRDFNLSEPLGWRALSFR